MAPDRGEKSTKIGASKAWDALTPPLSDWVLDATASMGFPKMTPVQASTIPLFMAHKDVVVEAVTGSGKTLAFLIPIIERLLSLEDPIKRHHVGAVIISPTRELACQIYNVLCSLLKFHGPSVDLPDSTEQNDGAKSSLELKVLPQLLHGGTSTAAQDLSHFLRSSPNVLISTPGRLLEILSSPHVHCPQSSFEVLVLDEADRLLDLGFKADLQKILAYLPKQRRTGLFSASVSEAVDQMIRIGLRNPVRIVVKVKGASGALDKRTPASLQMKYLVTNPAEKLPVLANLLEKLRAKVHKVVVYLSTCAAVDYFQSLLKSTILPEDTILVTLHGKYPAKVREKNFFRFVNATTPALLLTTDIAARGLDIPQVDLVVQIDPPSDPKVFMHRCGRAGRAGRRGLSVIFLQPGKEEDYISFLEVRQTPVELFTEHDVTPYPGQVDKISSRLRKLVLEDRALHDKAQKAFVSWTQSYTKHQASSIFRVADLDWADLAHGWGLLKLPKMPELKGWDRQLYQIEDIDWANYAYKDKQRELHRENARFEAESAETSFPSALADSKRKRSSPMAWSDKAEQKAHREVRRSKKKAQHAFVRNGKMTQEARDYVSETQKMLDLVRKQSQSMGTDEQS